MTDETTQSFELVQMTDKYMPESGLAQALVIYVRGEPGSYTGYVETITHLGAAIDFAFDDGDRLAEEQSWAEAFDKSGSPDGIYVLTCSWRGSDDDTELSIDQKRPLNSEERALVRDEASLEAVVYAWMPEFKAVKCRGCGQTGAQHNIYNNLKCYNGDSPTS